MVPVRSGCTKRHPAPYLPSPERGFDFPLTGADLITDRNLIRRHFPYLADQTAAVVHARRAGWLSAQQLGMVMLEAAREHGVKLLRGKVVGIDIAGGRVRHVDVDQQGERRSIEATHLVLAAGPMLKETVRLLGVDLPIIAERHLKISLPDQAGVVPRAAPMLIWLDEQHLPWSEDERAVLEEHADTRWLLQKFPAGVHGRPDGSGATTSLLALFNYDNSPAEVVFPVPPRAALRRDHAAGHVDHGSGPQDLYREGRAPVRRWRLLHQDAREPAADRTASSGGRLRIGRVLRIRA